MEPASQDPIAPPRRAGELPDRRTLAEEVLAVLLLSLLASAVFAVIDLLSAPLKGVTVASVDQDTQLARQLAGIVFGLAPVYLVVHLVRRSGEPWTFGLDPHALRAYLAQRRLALREDVGATEYRARYWGAAASHMRGYEFYRVAIADVERA